MERRQAAGRVSVSVERTRKKAVKRIRSNIALQTMRARERARVEEELDRYDDELLNPPSSSATSPAVPPVPESNVGRKRGSGGLSVRPVNQSSVVAAGASVSRNGPGSPGQFEGRGGGVKRQRRGGGSGAGRGRLQGNARGIDAGRVSKAVEANRKKAVQRIRSNIALQTMRARERAWVEEELDRLLDAQNAAKE